MDEIDKTAEILERKLGTELFSQLKRDSVLLPGPNRPSLVFCQEIGELIAQIVFRRSKGVVVYANNETKSIEPLTPDLLRWLIDWVADPYKPKQRKHGAPDMLKLHTPQDAR